MPDTPTYIFARVDLPAVDNVAQILFRKYNEKKGTLWTETVEPVREAYRDSTREFYSALEEAWEEG